MSMSYPAHIIFDLGGVVIDWNPEAIVRAVFEDEQVQWHVRKSVFEHPDWLEMDRGALSETEAIPRFAGRTGLPEDTVVELLRTSDSMLYVKDDTLALIRELGERGIDLYALSNIPAERFAALRTRYDFWEVFRGFVISGALGMVKPQREIYEHLLNTYGLTASSCLFLDDSRKNIEGAAAVGIDGFVFTDAAACRQKLAERFEWLR
jgi:putative hydrolase of the HAD superfamily